MITLSLVNNSGERVWLEVHKGSELRPVVQTSQPLGPYSSKEDVVQPVGSWDDDTQYAVYVFRRLPREVDSYYRVDLTRDDTLLIPPANGPMYFVGANYRTTGPLPTAVRWVTFAVLVALPLLAVIAFALFKTFFGRKASRGGGGNDGMAGPYSIGNIVFEGD
jgi:hypothetical protein